MIFGFTHYAVSLATITLLLYKKSPGQYVITGAWLYLQRQVAASPWLAGFGFLTPILGCPC